MTLNRIRVIRKTDRLEHTIPIPLIGCIALLPGIMLLYLFLARFPSHKETIQPILGNSVGRRLKYVARILVDKISFAIITIVILLIFEDTSTQSILHLAVSWTWISVEVSEEVWGTKERFSYILGRAYQEL